ncbi:MAG: hypothetical protein AAF497_03820, partial [Planctomycetota bacterium]
MFVRNSVVLLVVVSVGQLACADLTVTATDKKEVANQAHIEETRKAMLSRAPLDTGGDLEAHVWLVRDLMSRQRSPQEMADLERHLEHVVRLKPDAIDARVLLAQVFAVNKKTDLAIKQWKQLATLNPGLRFRYAEALATLGRQDDAIKVIEDARANPAGPGRPARALYEGADL